MYRKIRSSLTALSLFLMSSLCFASGIELAKKESPFKWKVSGTLKTGDTYYGQNISLLNNCNPEDRIIYTKHSLDVNTDLSYLDYLNARFSLRSKAVWGSSEIAPTTTVPTKTLDAVGQNHKHSIARHIFWMREAWLNFSLNKALGINSLDKIQTLTLGAFPFALGRGISLGSAYAVSPNYLGFYSDSAVDQYAFGAKLSGEIVEKKLSYDLYAAILDNRSNSLSKTGKKILGQQYGKLNKPERGFGKINYAIAGRLNITPVNDDKHGRLNIEPYFVFNSDPEQNVEFLADATSTLGTLGLASEFVSDRFEFGFETAFNLGSQFVKGWDRNVIKTQNRNGLVQHINSHVYVNVNPCSDEAATVDKNAYKAPHVVTAIASDGTVTSAAGSTARKLVNGSVQAASVNGKSLGIATDFENAALIPAAAGSAQLNELFNAKDRFRDPYKNTYKGWMFVTDAAWFVKNRDIRLAVTGAYVSGDQDPNATLIDGDYKGFIGLQELYAGKRVKSAFFLGSAGKLRLPLDIPETERQTNRFGALASGFTNLALIGGGVTWEPKDREKSLIINPNVLFYWETFPDRAFDLKTNTVLSCPSRSFLGTEFNIFFKKELMKNLKLFGILSLFVPGGHFYDVKGKPMNAAQFKILDRRDKTGYNDDAAPGLGTDLAYTFNFGFEYKF
ncbi:hypothetical protein KAH94_04310 [bacterium]|nr:hypothetical protein [bacterium]